ncbi:MAG: GNAT family N-acetyltransferase [Bacteroidales bacterium]|nr:GNAT family N-acetyltransferase [Bacteroidales bacterium]
MELKIATTEDRGRLGAVWKECFGLDDEYLHLFQNLVLTPTLSQTFILQERGELLSTFTLLPIQYLTTGGRCFNGAYLAAVATPKKFRGHRYFSQLFRMSMALNNPQIKELDFILVRPAEKNLTEIYRREGFDIGIKNSITDSFEITPSDTMPYDKLNMADKEAVTKLVEEIATNLKSFKPLFLWDSSVIEFVVADSFSNGKTRTQLNYFKALQLAKSTGVIEKNVVLKKDFAFVKILNPSLTPQDFTNALFLFTLE